MTILSSMVIHRIDKKIRVIFSPNESRKVFVVKQSNITTNIDIRRIYTRVIVIRLDPPSKSSLIGMFSNLVGVIVLIASENIQMVT